MIINNSVLPTLKLIRFFVNHNTKECHASFGIPFQFNGPLIKLPCMWEGRPTHVLGLTPYTVEQVIPFPYDKIKQADSICSYSDVATMISRLKSLNI